MNRGEAAVHYAREFGFAVFPCTGKQPLTPNGHHGASTDVSEIRSWWERYPEANIGINVRASGIAVLDLDTKLNQGIKAIDSLHQIEEKFGRLPQTPNSITPRDGIHFYFRASADPCRIIGLMDGVDWLGDGFAIAPPSEGYSWDQWPEENPIAPLPSWLEELVLERRSSNAALTRAARKPSTYWDQLLREGVSEGRRNDTIAQVAGHLFRHSVDPALAFHLLQSLNKSVFQPSLSEAEVDRTITSIAKRERAHRGGTR